MFSIFVLFVIKYIYKFNIYIIYVAIYWENLIEQCIFEFFSALAYTHKRTATFEFACFCQFFTTEDMSLDSKKAVKGIVKSADMPDDLQMAAFQLAHDALAKFETERDIAQEIKKAFDEQHGATWHCVVGKSFGSFVTHERYGMRWLL